MIWLTWRQHRSETLVAALALALLTALLIPTGLQVAESFDAGGIAACLSSGSAGCQRRLIAFESRFDSLQNLVAWFNLLPGLIGVLLAAPFIRELEHSTFRLAWTQSISRRRWVATRLALIVFAALVVAVLLTLLMTWWRDPFDDLEGRMMPAGFNFEGTVVFGYVLFAAAATIAYGVVTRRAAAAIGLGLVSFLVARLAIEMLARPHYRPAENAVWSADGRPDLTGAWVLEEGPSNAAGLAAGTLGGQPAPGTTPKLGAGEYFHALYQPDSRFWLFQGIETTIFVGVAAAMLGFTVWWLRTRVS